LPAYYNENDPFAVAWLRELIKAKLIADGEVDERSIEDVQPSDLGGFEQCHFFAGIGGWNYALRLAGWPDSRPVWTGSCPCQPFSAAGKRNGFKDARHLFPVWFRLIRECRPVSVFGEQVGAAVKWFDVVSRKLETQGYTVGATVLGAHSVSAPHIRQRFYWLANSNHGRFAMYGSASRATRHTERCGKRILAYPSLSNQDERTPSGKQQIRQSRKESLRLADSASAEILARPGEIQTGTRKNRANGSRNSRSVCELGHSSRQRLQTVGWQQRPERNEWDSCDWIYCLDQKYRPVEPGTFPLAHGVPARVGRLRGYGNAIVPQVAAEFVKAYLEICTENHNTTGEM
jgi:DNA (cytosine-5)-methyltransferase 1